MQSGEQDLDGLREEALAAIDGAADLEALEAVRVRYTGRRSLLAERQREIPALPQEQRRTRGAAVNAFRSAFEARYEQRHAELTERALRARLEAERVDLTLPPPRVRPGRPHLITQVMDEIVDVFVGLGYRVAEGPEAEAAAFSFDLLNIPPDHPARLDMDTIYLAGDEQVVLRPHTSPVQARVMLVEQPPIAVVVPGRVFRQDTPDATHSPVFHQVEGLLVAAGISMADLRGTLLHFLRALFGGDREMRLRPSFFPFTEPSAEVDVSCLFCSRAPADGRCRVCGGTGWVELLGAGMVDPAVLEACGQDPDAVSGFAFGVGVERVAMFRHGVADIRDLYEGDVRFLTSF